MKIATWNVNSIRSRLDHFLKWQADFKPDVVLLQETKCTNDNFPSLEIEAEGYNMIAHGQKSYNGVAIIARGNIVENHTSLPDFEDEQCRYIEATIDGVFRVASVYVPNGSEVGSDKFDYKLRFYDALHKHLRSRMGEDTPFIVGGDYNVAFDDKDVYDPAKYRKRVLFSRPERQALHTLTNLGYADVLRIFEPSAHLYSWWDYREGSWAKDQGLRIDHLLANPQATDKLKSAGIDKTPRGWEKPSDHTPVWCEVE